MHLQSPLFGDWWQPWLKLTNESNKTFKFSSISWAPPKYVLWIEFQQQRPQMPICTYLKQVGAPPISQNSWDAKSTSVSTKDTRDAYDRIFTPI